MVTLYAHQEEVVKMNRKKMILGWETGVAKTMGAIAMMYHQRASTFFVVCPKRVVSKWLKEISEWEETVGFTTPHRVITKEQFKNIPIEKLKKVGAVIIDEYHNHFGVGSDLNKHTMNYFKAANPSIVYLLSATYYGSSPWNIYYTVKMMGGEINYPEFKKKCFRDGRFGVESKDDNECRDYLAQLISPWLDAREMSDVVEYPDIKVEVWNCDKPVGWCEWDRGQWDNPLVWLSDMHQLESVGAEKMEMLAKLWRKHGRLVVVCNFSNQIDVYKAHFGGLGILCSEISGRVDDGSIERSRAILGAGGVVLVQSRVAEGYELPEADAIVFASMNFSYIAWRQASGRIRRRNKIQQVFHYYLITVGGIDEAVYKSVVAKKRFSDRMYLQSRGILI